MKYIPIVLGVLAVIVLIAAVSTWRANRRLKRYLKNEYGKPPAREYDKYDMDSIASCWEHRLQAENPPFAVDETTWRDLDMDKVFRRINSACSSVGEEALYSALHDQAYDPGKLARMQSLMDFFDGNPDTRLDVQFHLSRLGRVPSNGMLRFFYKPAEQRLRHRALYPVLALLALLSIATLFIHQGVAIGFIAVILITNMVVYYKTKIALEAELVSVRYISSLVSCAGELSRIKAPPLAEHTARLAELHARLKSLGKMTGFILNRSASDLDALFEYVKIFFMLDFTVYNRVISILRKHAGECMELYKIVGYLDAAIAAASYRRSVELCSAPEFTSGHEIIIEDMVHPLIDRPVANSVTLGSSALITGSNASGKSTFIKAVAINAILAQTLHLCLASRFALQPSFVVTSMAVSDDVTAGESYFIAEIKSLKRVLDGLNPHVRCLCFIDEILKGTNTIERIAASAAVLDALSRENCLALIATHDIELTELMPLYGNYHFREEVRDDGIRFDYRIHDGQSTTKNAIRLLAYMGFGQAITGQAEAMARSFEQTRTWRTLDITDNGDDSSGNGTPPHGNLE